MRTDVMASAIIGGRSGFRVQGLAEFQSVEGDLRLVLTVDSAPPGEYSVQINEYGDCSSPDGRSAGPIWGGAEPRGADIGVLKVDEGGAGRLEVLRKDWTLGTGAANDVNGHAILLMKGAGRIACGAISLKGRR